MWAYRKSYGFLELILSELLNVLYFFATFYLHFFLFLGQMGRAGQKNKRIIKTYVFAMFSEILGSCPAHSFFYFFKKNQKNVKLTAAHQYWGAPQCTDMENCCLSTGVTQWARNWRIEGIFVLNKFVVICRFLSVIKLKLNILFQFNFYLNFLSKPCVW